MALKLTMNVIDGCDLQEDGRPGFVNTRATKLCYVDGVGGDDNALATALAFVQSQFRAYQTPYHPSKPWCVATGYRNESVAEDSNSVRVRVFFTTLQFSIHKAGQPQWSVEEDSQDWMNQTQLDTDGKPMWVSWASAKDPSLKAEDMATLTYPEPVATVNLSGILTPQQLTALRKGRRHVNDQKWNGLDIGHWRFGRLSTRAYVGTTLIQVRVQLDGKEELDWSAAAVLKDQRDGKFKADETEAARVRKLKYKYGVIAKTGGIFRIGFYKTADFKGLFGFDHVDQLYQSGGLQLVTGANRQ